MSCGHQDLSVFPDLDFFWKHGINLFSDFVSKQVKIYKTIILPLFCMDVKLGVSYITNCEIGNKIAKKKYVRSFIFCTHPEIVLGR
jgi:hypothetical protein